MKRIIFYASLVMVAFIVSCSEDFDPFAEANQKYVLNCIVRCDTTYQTLTLTTTYMVTNYNPYSSTSDPSIKGAVIRLWEGNDKVTFFTDTTISRDSSSLYTTPYSIYHARGIQPDPDTVVSIEAILPNGKKLTSSGTTPQKPAFQKLGQLGGTGDTIVPPVGKSFVKAQWGEYTSVTGTVYYPRAYIVYTVPENGVTVRKTKMLPISYFTYEGVEYPEYPGLSYYPLLTIDTSIVNRCMKEISAGSSIDKENYKIYALIVEVLSLDANLTTYYNATNKNKDPYAVKLYETDYSNIVGGYGIFGICFKASTSIDISAEYVRTFGYVHAYAKD